MGGILRLNQARLNPVQQTVTISIPVFGIGLLIIDHPILILVFVSVHDAVIIRISIQGIGTVQDLGKIDDSVLVGIHGISGIKGTAPGYHVAAFAGTGIAPGAQTCTGKLTGKGRCGNGIYELCPGNIFPGFIKERDRAMVGSPTHQRGKSFHGQPCNRQVKFKHIAI